MDISFHCNNCGQHVVIDEAGAETAVQCPCCGRELIVPNSNQPNPVGEDPQRAEADEKADLERQESRKEEPATDKQMECLKFLGARFDPAGLSKVNASTLIEDALSMRSPTQEQIEELRRLGLLEELEGEDTAFDASAMLRDALLNPPTKQQAARARELGFRFGKVEEFKAGELDDILKLADREPDLRMLDALGALGLRWSNGTALEARMVLDLASEYGTLGWEMDGVEIARACAAAMRDVAFSQPTISNGTPGLARFRWPKAKMGEWAASGRPAAGSSHGWTAKA